NGNECGANLFCVDGVCCENTCGDGHTNDCQACSVAMGGSADGSCTPIAAGHTCRDSAGMCDVAEVCDGTSRDCPSDGFQPETTTCRASVSVCDVAETCTGTSAACPPDGFAPPTTTCRASVSVCDVAETCTGTSAACPPDGFAPPTTT